MERRGYAMSPDKASRLWAKAGLQVPRKRPRKRVAVARSRVEAKVVIGQWRRHYNEVRPHSSLGNMTPQAYRLLETMNLNLEVTLKN